MTADRPLADGSVSTPINRRRFLQATAGGSAVALTGCLHNGEDPEAPDTITLGVLAPRPDATAMGDAMANPPQILADEINENGGLLDADVEVVVKDTDLDPSRTLEMHRELMLEDEANATFGLLSSEGGLRVFDEIGEHQTVHIAGGTAVTDFNDEIRDNYEDKRYWFRTHPNGEVQGENQARFADEMFEELGWDRVGLLIEDIAGYQPNANAFQADAPDTVDFVFEEVFAPGTEDYRPFIEQARANDVDVLWALGSVTDAILIDQWGGDEPDFDIGGVLIAATNPNFHDDIGNSDFATTSVPGGIPTFRPTDRTEQFLDDYDAEFGGSPPFYSAYTTFDGVLAWVEAVREAETVDPDEIIPTLEEISFEGVQGTIEFHDRDAEYAHDLIHGPDHVTMPVIQWQDETPEVIWPGDVATGEYQRPDWI